jgi:hypothetical protein
MNIPACAGPGCLFSSFRKTGYLNRIAPERQGGSGGGREKTGFA